MIIKGIPFKGLQKAKQKAIITAIQSLYNQQFSLLTEERVRTAIKNLEFPDWFYLQSKQHVDVFISTMKVAIKDAVLYTAVGDGPILGMLDEINMFFSQNTPFNVNIPSITGYIERESARLAVDLTKNQHAWIKSTLKTSSKEGWSLKQTIESLKGDMTLTKHESEWALSYREKMYKKYLKEYQGLSNPAARANATADRLYAKKVRFYQDVRSSRIAKTELKRAHGEGTIESCKQAIEAGVIKQAWATWRRSSVVDNWPSTLQFDGKRVKVGTSFGTVNGRTTMTGPILYPKEINDQCYIEISVAA